MNALNPKRSPLDRALGENRLNDAEGQSPHDVRSIRIQAGGAVGTEAGGRSRSETKPFRMALGVLASMAVALTGCNKAETATAAVSSDPKVEAGRIVFPADSPQLATLVVAPVKPCADCRLRLNGRLAWNDDVTVRVFSPFAGRVTRISASHGARVEKDAPLAVLTSPDFGQAETDARKASTDLALAERNVSRLRELVEHGAAPVKDLSAAEADLSRAQSEASRTHARLASYGIETDVIDNTFTIRSPIAGVVVERNLNAGQEVRPDQMLANIERLAAPLFVVTDPAKLWLMLDMSEAEAAKIEVGQALEIRVPTQPDRVFRAVLDFESDALDPLTRTVKARAAVDNIGRQLKAEQLVSVEIVSANTTQLLDVPAAAVFLKGDRHFVYAEIGTGTFVRREVHVGSAQKGQVQITDGLKTGERVVTDGVMLLEQVLETAPTDQATKGTSSAL